MKLVTFRRTIVRGAAGAAAVATSAAPLGIKPCSIFAAPALVQPTCTTVDVNESMPLVRLGRT